MPTTQEWLTENSNRRFPFSTATASAANAIPEGLIADLRFFTGATTTEEVYLSQLDYNEPIDSFTVQFSSRATGDVLLSGTLTRLDGSESRKFKKCQIASGATVCLFTPGELWDDPSWGYSVPSVPESWSKTWAFSEAEVEPSEVLPGIAGFRRIFILKDGYPIPDESLWPVNSTQRIHAGYNINIQEGDKTLLGTDADSFLKNVLTLSVEPGAGEGYPPGQDPTAIDYVGTINGTTGDGSGNIRLELADCLRVFQPVDGGNAPIPNTLMLNSDCLPCCDCGDYTAVSAAISRRSAKIKDENNFLNATIQSVATIYNNALESIRTKKAPIIVIRNVRSIEDSITFSVQNISSVPAYAYVGIQKGGGLPSDLAVKSGQTFLSVLMTSTGNFCATIAAHRAGVAALPYTKYENPSATMPPEFNCSADIGLFVGYPEPSSGAINPIPAGGRVDVILNSASIRSSIDAYIASHGGAGFVSAASFDSLTLAYSAPTISFSAIGVYGATICYPCMPDNYSVTFKKTQAPAPTGCGTGGTYTGVQV
jgi:hypothetical protein